MKTQTVRQISISKVPSRQVHEALVHSRNQAKHTVVSLPHTVTAGARDVWVDEKKTMTLFHDSVRGTPHYSIVAFDQSFSTAFPDGEFLLHEGPLSQYEVLKQHWSTHFLNTSNEITQNSA